MTTILLVIVFIIGYGAIALEHSLQVNKAASALITGVLCWTIYILQAGHPHEVSEQLVHMLGEIAGIVFFLLGAMTIVELIDIHSGFDSITRNIKTRSKKKLLFLVTLITFVLSALLDNLTTTIVMVSLCNKMLTNRDDRRWFAGMIIIAANAGGVWSPLGDVTTTMLWIGGQITASSIIRELVLPSLAVCLVPMLIMGRRFGKQQIASLPVSTCSINERREGKIILISGMSLLVGVPVFKTVTHLPPFMGMLLALGVMWLITTVIHRAKQADAVRYSVAHALQKIDTPSILFFLGILLAIGALQSFGLLTQVADSMHNTLKNDYLIGACLGVTSAVVDNVPLVAAAQGMYGLSMYPTDHAFWLFLALTTGTGGSIIIIGSAAGVAAMGIEEISFGWYMKRIAWLALLGFLAGILVFLWQPF